MKKHLITIVIVSLVCIICGFGAFLFFNQESRLESEIIALQKEVRQLEVQANSLTVQKPVSSFDASIEELNEYFVSADGALDFVKYIEDLATSAGLSYRINSFDAEDNPDISQNDKEYLKTSLTATGSMKNIRNFISLIESLPYNIKITRVDLKSGGVQSLSASREQIWTLMIDFSVVKIMEKE